MFFGEGNVYILLNVLQHLSLNYYPIKYNLNFTHFYSHGFNHAGSRLDTILNNTYSRHISSKLTSIFTNSKGNLFLTCSSGFLNVCTRKET